MTGYIFKRLLEMIPTLFGITLISFAILHLAPGKPTDVLTELNPKITRKTLWSGQTCIFPSGKGLEKLF
jgi:peptide/nickel transport system permease protein